MAPIPRWIPADLAVHGGLIAAGVREVGVYSHHPDLSVFWAKYLPSWPPSSEIRTARAKFTDHPDICMQEMLSQRLPDAVWDL